MKKTKKHFNNTDMKDQRKDALIIVAIILIPFAVHLGYHLIVNANIKRALGPAREITITPQRGRILAADGSIIARSDSMYTLHADCTVRDSSYWAWKVMESAPGLDRMFPREDTSGWLPVLIHGREQQKKYLLIADSLREEQVDSLKALPLFSRSFGCAIIEAHPVRVHPFSTLAGATIGSTREDGRRTGLELFHDYNLYGVDGHKKSRSGHFEGRYFEKVEWHLPVRNGNDISTTLKMDQQATADSILRSAILKKADIGGGCLVAMSAETGAIRAIANLTRIGDRIDEAENLAIRRTIEPGRIVDIMSCAALLADAHVCSVGEAASSGNDVARLVREHYGEDPQAYIDKMRSFLPDFKFDLDLTPATWIDSSLKKLSSGEGMRVTPLSLLAFTNCLANRGQMVQPFLVHRIIDEEGCVLMEHTPAVFGEIPEDVADALRQWLLSAGSVPGVALLSGVSRGAATCVAFTGEGPGYSVICTLFMDGRQDSRAGTLAERIVLDMIENLQNR